MSRTIKLKSPITTHNGPLAELKLNEPKAGSFIRHGEPFKTRVVSAGGEDRVELDFNYKSLAGFISDMSEPRIDDILVEGLSSADFMAVRNAVVDLVLGITGTSENPSQS